MIKNGKVVIDAKDYEELKLYRRILVDGNFPTSEENKKLQSLFNRIFETSEKCSNCGGWLVRLKAVYAEYEKTRV